MSPPSPPSPAAEVNGIHAHDAPTEIPAWMPVREARAILAAARLRALPVSGHAGLVGLVTIEALGGHDGPPPAPDAPVLSAMDWHLVRVPIDADEAATLHAFEQAAWAWLRTRELDTHPGP